MHPLPDPSIRQPSPYPTTASDRNAWIQARRGQRNRVSASRAYSWLSELEPDPGRGPARVDTVFLTNKECPWKCVMCDLWVNTLEESVAPGQIPQQIHQALKASRQAGNPTGQWVKLYNSGSFFDPNAIPVEDHPLVAGLIAPYEKVIIECHPALVGPRVLGFREKVRGRLQVAVGLETAHLQTLLKLNKGLDLARLRRSLRFLLDNEMETRVFILVPPPFMGRNTAYEWVCRTIDFAVEMGVHVISLVPTRKGNGALDALMETGDFFEPSLVLLERSLDYGLAQGQSTVLMDLWDLHRFATCESCFEARRERMERINLSQQPAERIACRECRDT